MKKNISITLLFLALSLPSCLFSSEIVELASLWTRCGNLALFCKKAEIDIHDKSYWELHKENPDVLFSSFFAYTNSSKEWTESNSESFLNDLVSYRDILDWSNRCPSKSAASFSARMYRIIATEVYRRLLAGEFSKKQMLTCRNILVAHQLNYDKFELIFNIKEERQLYKNLITSELGKEKSLRSPFFISGKLNEFAAERGFLVSTHYRVPARIINAHPFLIMGMIVRDYACLKHAIFFLDFSIENNGFPLLSQKDIAKSLGSAAKNYDFNQVDDFSYENPATSKHIYWISEIEALTRETNANEKYWLKRPANQ